MNSANYRPEIDGLRAIAVLAVIFFHAGFKTFSGGFVGVDVFFVISGYLITLLLISESRSQSFSLLHFYDRRIRRILPALILVMFVCLPFAWVLMNPVELRQFLMSALSVATFSSNLFFMLKTAYFDLPSETNPLLHTWTLAVEEQYYILFPLLFIVVWKFNKKIMGLLFFVVALISLGLAQWALQKYAAISFYLLPTRAWEILIGSLLAIYVSNGKKPELSPFINNLGGLLGLLLIFYPIFFYNKNTPTPSIFILIPVLGASLILLCCSQATLLGKVLSNRLLVGIGLISYSLYLWHQPIFAFSRINALNEPSYYTFLGLIIIALAISFLSWKFIEIPFRNAKQISSKKILYASAIASTFFISVGILAFYTPDVITFAKLQNKKEDIYKLDLYSLQSQSRALTNIYAKEEKNQVFLTNKIRVLVIGDSMADDFITAAMLSPKITNKFELIKLSYDDLCFDKSNIAQDCLDSRKNFNSGKLKTESDLILMLVGFDPDTKLGDFIESNQSIKNKLVIISSSHFNHPYGFAKEIGPLTPLDYQRLGKLFASQKHTNTVAGNIRASQIALTNKITYVDGYSIYCQNDQFCPFIDKSGEILIFDTAHKTPNGFNYYRERLENWFNTYHF